MSGRASIPVVITTLDNCPMLRRQLPILRQDPYCAQIIVVNNGSEDDTRAFLDDQERRFDDLTVIHRENLGAGPGRNAGIDAAFAWGDWGFISLYDGGMRPLVGGTEKMCNYLQRHPEVDLVAPDWHMLATSEAEAWHRWPHEILDGQAYRNSNLSLTHFCLARRRAFDGIRFAEHGPFGQPGWGCDDDELAHRWCDEGIVVHAVQGIKAYRRASGSFARLQRETGVWPADHGSVYEQRLVWMQQYQSKHGKGVQWGLPWLTVVVEVGAVDWTAKTIKQAHDLLRKRRNDPPWQSAWNPYQVVAWGGDPSWHRWAGDRALRQHHGNKIIIEDKIVLRKPSNESTWTGDFRIWQGDNWQDAVLPEAYLYGLVREGNRVEDLIAQYNEIHPRQPHCHNPPRERREITGR